MKTSTRLYINYRYQNWGITEKIVCEQDSFSNLTFILFRQGQNVGTIFKEGNVWQSSSNIIFLPLDVEKIGLFIDDYLAQNHLGHQLILK